jgi:hypothetical protein
LVDEGTQTFSGEFVTEMLDERGRQVMSCWGKIAAQRLIVEGPPLDGYRQ